MSHVRLQDHHYLMRDHGLFVAGIIHSLAPAAEIHLFEVLNEYGVGDIMTITEGLKNALASRSGQYLVVNCSLVLSLTPVDSRNPRLLGKRLRDFKPIVHMHGEELETWVERHVLPLRWACQNIYQAGSRVVAAAGNDKKGKIRPQADYPAAFESVVGVGALQKGRLEPASYSNFSDRPETTGIITLGGEQGEEQGVLGIYLGNFPAEAVGVQAPENESGWAWWAGTSFATPIMTGLVAALLGTGKYPTTEAAIRALYAANVFQTTSSNEDALVVEQG